MFRDAFVNAPKDPKQNKEKESEQKKKNKLNLESQVFVESNIAGNTG